MNLKVTSHYLWMPVSVNSPQVKLHLFAEGEKIQEIDICLGNAEWDFYVSLDVTNWIGLELTVQSDEGKELPACFQFREEKPDYSYAYRPQLHFSPEVGWHNDPNGLVYADGFYRLYYQWNPYGIVWGNMHWGHAVSKDLIHWEHKPAALYPDHNGTIFSGSGIADIFNKLDNGNDTLVFYYTAAGGSNNWSKETGNRFTQRMAYSTDGGTTLVKSDHFIMENIIHENRDPKVFYHENSDAYIMIMFLDGFDFEIFRSDDLIHWKETQKLHYEGMWECPDLFQLTVDKTENSRWVFWSADGYYVVGTFDGYIFQAESEVLNAYSTKLPYAAQTYTGTEGRIISIAWLRMKNHRGNYCGLMSLPMELLLTNTDNRIRIKFKPAEEFNRLENTYQIFSEEGLTLKGKPVCIKLRWDIFAEGVEKLQIGNTEVVIDLKENHLTIDTKEPEREITHISLSNSGNRLKQNLKFIIDQEVIEFLGNDGTLYGAVEVEENILGKSIMEISSGTGVIIGWCELASEAGGGGW